MRGRFLPLCTPLLVLAMGIELAGPEPKPDYSQPYMLIDTFRLATLRKEINQAAAAGYRVVNAVPLVTEQHERVLFLEKSSHPGEAYEYFLIGPPVKSFLFGKIAPTKPLEEDLNDGGGKGYRLLPHTLDVDVSLGGRVVLMEKTPGPRRRYHYLVRERSCKADRLKQIQQAMEQGYRLVSITPFGVVLEKPERAMAEPKPPGGFGSELSTYPQYLCLDTVRESTLQKELDAAAGAGYRIVVYGYSAMALLEKSAAPPETYQYKLLRSSEDVPEAAAAGFRLVPEASRGGHLLMEKVPGSTDSYEYLVIKERRTDRTLAALNRVHNEGYRLVCLSQSGGYAYIVVERPASPAPE